MFQEFPPSRRISPRSAALSLAVHAAAISGLIAVFAAPPPQVRVRPLHITLIAPALEPPPPPQAIRKAASVPPPPVIQAEPRRAFTLPPARPKPAPLRTPPPMLEAPREMARVQAPAPEMARATPVLPPPVLTGTFQTQSTPVRREAAAQVTVMPAGFAASAAPLSPLPRGTIVASAGGFDAAAVSGSAARRGMVLLGSGFGDAGGSATAAIARPAAAGAGFGDAAATTPTRAARAAESNSPTLPAEILEKPRPAYTDEARRLSIEGEVLLEVLFQASGQIRIERIIHGLGHGLDESAEGAARQIRFKPARRDGAPVDSLAVVHISFQLAY